MNILLQILPYALCIGGVCGIACGCLTTFWSWLVKEQFSSTDVLSMALTVNILIPALGRAPAAIADGVKGAVKRSKEVARNSGWRDRLDGCAVGEEGNKFVKLSKKLLEKIEECDRNCEGLFSIAIIVVKVLMILCAVVAVILAVLEYKGHLTTLLFLPFPLYYIYCWHKGLKIRSDLDAAVKKVNKQSARIDEYSQESFDQRKQDTIAAFSKVLGDK